MLDNLVFTFSGQAGSGKDLCAEMVKHYCKTIGLEPFSLAFADSLKMHCARNFGYDDSDKENGRHVLQEFGTKVREIEKDYWARQVYIAIDAFRSMFDVFVITDARYENEMQLFPFNLCYPIINVYVKRDFPTALGDVEYTHESEAMAQNPDLSKFHYVIDNNGELENTYEQIVDMISDILDKRVKLGAEQLALSLKNGDADE